MERMQQELEASHPDLDIQFIGVNEWGEEEDNSKMTDGRDLPWLQDVDDDGDNRSDVWTSWGILFEDVVVLDANSELVSVYNVLFNEILVPENYDYLRQVVFNVASSYPGDCNDDGEIDAADLACVTEVGQRDVVLETLNTLPGDLDGNGAINFTDFLTFAANFGRDRPRYTHGNIDLEGGIGFLDFLVFANNFGRTPNPVAAAPEPNGSLELDVTSRDEAFGEWAKETSDLSATISEGFLLGDQER